MIKRMKQVDYARDIIIERNERIEKVGRGGEKEAPFNGELCQMRELKSKRGAIIGGQTDKRRANSGSAIPSRRANG